ncbi:hypothetical protein CKO41_04115 [Thiococcus pfennigii]|nr:hypothetical protein [Thiococcus pfennigii]
MGAWRDLRIEFGGASYHLTSRGDRREAVYEDDEDRHLLRDEADGSACHGRGTRVCAHLIASRGSL